METLKILKSKLTKGSKDSKKEAFFRILREYGDQPKVLEFVANKLALVPSVELFNEIIKSDEVKILPISDIYIKRLTESKNPRVRQGIITREFVDLLPEPKAKQLFQEIALNDPDIYVRDQALRVLASGFENANDDSIMNLMETSLSRYDEGGGVFYSSVFENMSYLPFSQRIHDFIKNELTKVPIKYNPYTIMDPVRTYPEEFRPIIPIIKKIIQTYIDDNNKSVLGKIKTSIFSKFSSSHEDVKNDFSNIDYLGLGLLSAYEADEEIINYLYDVTVKLNSPESKLLGQIFVKLVHSTKLDPLFSRQMLQNFIEDERLELLTRYYAIDSLYDFYKSKKIAVPEDLLSSILEIFKNECDAFKEDVIHIFSSDKNQIKADNYNQSNQDTTSISVEDCQIFFDLVCFALNEDEKNQVWQKFLNQSKSNNHDLNSFFSDFLDSASQLPFTRIVIFHIDYKDKDEVESYIDSSIKTLDLPQDIQVYKKDLDYSLEVMDQLSLYAKAIKAYDYLFIDLDLGWNDYCGVVIRLKDKKAFDDFFKRNPFCEKYKYL